MTTTVNLREKRRMLPPGTDVHFEACSQRVADATKELGAFHKAFEGLFGSVIAADAAECWVKLAESSTSSTAINPRHWRQITISAASQMATRYCLSRPYAFSRGATQ